MKQEKMPKAATTVLNPPKGTRPRIFLKVAAQMPRVTKMEPKAAMATLPVPKEMPRADKVPAMKRKAKARATVKDRAQVVNGKTLTNLSTEAPIIEITSNTTTNMQ